MPCSFTDGTNISEDHSAPFFRAKYTNLECNFSFTAEFNLAVGYQHFEVAVTVIRVYYCNCRLPGYNTVFSGT